MATVTAQLKEISPVLDQLKKMASIYEKTELICQNPNVKNVQRQFTSLIQKNEIEESYVLAALVFLKQEHILFSLVQATNPHLSFKKLVKDLIDIEHFYAPLGGIIGYHFETLRLLAEKEKEASKDISYHPHRGFDMSQAAQNEIQKRVLQGISALAQMAEIYPVGGAADRLGLRDEKTGICLPAARLKFFGKTLIERLVCDLQAREYLYYKLFNQQIITPLAMMTSDEKNNHQQIIQLFEESSWFGRPKESYRFFSQPLVPAMDETGVWALAAEDSLLMKPGGHGVIWKLAQDSGIFNWFSSLGRSKALVRQINNLIAGVDHGIFALIGIGCAENKQLGFTSCQRPVQASEGINVLIEKKRGETYEYLLTNIEYCELDKFRIKDEPEAPSAPFSRFGANINLLFIDLEAIQRAISLNPFPGKLVNSKRMKTFQAGQIEEQQLLRLETTMQNIADVFAEERSAPLKDQQSLSTFLVYNHRQKTISPIKKERKNADELFETPEGCFLDFLRNSYELLTDYCGVSLPEMREPQEMLKNPPFIFHYHPALGPLYSIIGQKIRGGQWHFGSEFTCELAEVYIEELKLQGSLLLKASHTMGKLTDEILTYSEECARCILKNVTVQNRGIDSDRTKDYWKETMVKERLTIQFHGMGEFYAEDVTFKGDLLIEVPNCMRVIATQDTDGSVQLEYISIDRPSWSWRYSVNGSDIILQK